MELTPIQENEIHLWHIPLTPPRRTLLSPPLSDDELVRADRFLQERDRNRYMICRGALRSVLGHYTQTLPRELKFEYGKKNKPALVESYGSKAISFNLSHSSDLALLALASHPR